MNTVLMMVLRGGGDLCGLGPGDRKGMTPQLGRPVFAKQGGENAQRSGLPEHTWHKEGGSGKESR